MKIVQFAKTHKLITIVGLIYFLLTLFAPEKAYNALASSGYYLFEMVQILPVIFLLTVSIDVLIPKEWIIKHMGESSGFIGGLLSLVLGSVSAGPIYAAFPISKMLLKKGASVGNIVIILSAWAVVKVPMLANEVKFLGPSFMAVRWLLTVTAIFLMAWVMNRMIKRDALMSLDSSGEINGLSISKDYCTGCGLCVKKVPEVFEMTEGKATVNLTSDYKAHIELVKLVSDKCPVRAINLNTPA